jgi:hypothetical protein
VGRTLALPTARGIYKNKNKLLPPPSSIFFGEKKYKKMSTVPA